MPTTTQRARLWVRPSWQGDGGIRALLAVAGPLILSQIVHAANTFLDRLFLAHYSQDTFAAALQAGVTWWTVLAIWVGVVGYAGTFVAQYTGADEDDRVGPAVWQGFYLALGGGAVMLCTTLFSGRFFHWVGHAGNLPALESAYYNILCICSVFVLIANAFSAFYLGRGKTWFVLGVSAASLLTNTFLNWWFIFHGGPFGLVPRGIEGAAWATVLATLQSSTIYWVCATRRANDARYGTRRGWRPQGELLGRLVRFGLPAGLHNFVDMFAFSTFLLVVGKFGFAAQYASNVAMSLNMLVFFPAMGIHVACQILTGQYIGARTPALAEKTAISAALICVVYFVTTGLVYLLAPELIISFFYTPNVEQTVSLEEILPLARVLLLFVALYSIFDAIALVFSGTVKGAGDTRFVLILSVVLSQALLTLPCVALWIWAEQLPPTLGLNLAWGFCTLYIMATAAIFAGRYWAGHWMRMNVIGRREGDDPPAATEAADRPVAATV